MHPRKSFTFLINKLPDCIIGVNTLINDTAKLQEQFALESANPKTRRSNDGSKIDNNDGLSFESALKVATVLSSPQCTPANKPSSATAGWERKKHSDTRNLVTWYDIRVQKKFESLVEDIALARNELRKSRMSSVRMEMFQSPPIRRTPLARSNLTNGVVPNTEPSAMRNSANSLEDNAFDKANEELRAAESLCQSTAYQFLRDGSCQLGLEGIKKRLECALRIGTAELERLGKTKMIATQEGVESSTKEEATYVDTAIPAGSSAQRDVQLIEVDDSSSSDNYVDVDAFRLAWWA